MLSRPHQGVTLVELLVGMSILAILLGLGVPSFATYLQSAKLNTAAQSYLAGVQMARSEAIRRNLPVEFVLTNTPVETADIANSLAESANGQNWVVRVFDPGLAPPAFVLIESKSATEGASSNVGPQSVQIVGAGAPAAFTGILSFNGFGATVTNSAYRLDVSNPAGGACAPAGPMRCPALIVPAGGLVHLCDPLVTATTDSRGC